MNAAGRLWAAVLAAGLMAMASPAQAFLKGLASNPYLNTDPAKVYHTGARWAYHWGPNKPANLGSLEFVPMLWDETYVTAANITALTNGRLAGDYTHLLGFNEPDLASQANMTPEQAISYWPQLLSTGLILGAPAVASPYIASQTNPALYWIDHFMQLANAAGYRVDFIPLHIYTDFTDPNAPSWVAGWLADVYARFGKPIWITEIGSWNGTYGTPPSAQLSGRYMENVLEMMDTLPYVQRVAWFMDQCWGTPACQYTSLYNAVPQLTGVGQFYKDYPQQAVPGRIQAEDYSAFNDSSPGNSGGQYRLDNVDIEACADLQAGWNLGWIAAGEWLDYRLNVATAGTYDLSFRVAVPGAAQSLQLRLDGALFGGALSLPSTGGNQAWSSVVMPGMSLPAGQHTLRVQATGGGFNFNYVDIAPSHAAPGRIEAEDFSGYSDTDTANNGSPWGAEYRFQDVDLNVCSDTGGGYNLGWTVAGEWLEFPLTVASAAAYQFDLRVASASAGPNTLQLRLDGALLGAPFSVPNTGGWQAWTTLMAAGLSLPAGQHTLRLEVTAGSFNLNYIDTSLPATPTRTATASQTRTSTLTPSPSASATLSSTASPSRTATPSRTPSPSPTFTVTSSATATVSATLSATLSVSPSAIPSSSASPSNTATGTASATGTGSPSPSATAEPSPSASPTPTPSPTFTDVPPGSTVTDTPTVSPTPTASATPTSSSSASPTPTASATATPSSSASPTPTPSSSATPSGSRTPTLSSTASASATSSATATVVFSASATTTPPLPASGTPTPSPVVPATSTPSPSATALPPGSTVPAPATVAAPRILDAAFAPNPSRAGGAAVLACKLDQAADRLRAEIYTRDMKLLAALDLPGRVGPGWANLPCRAPDLANGIYFVRLKAGNAMGGSEYGKTLKWMLLR